MSDHKNQFPEHARRVFKGVLFEVWQWDQKMYDGSTEVFEKLKRADSVNVIPVIGDNILIQEQEQPDKPMPFPSLPGGRCEEGEDALSAARRELLEETGYESDDWELWRQETPSHKIVWTASTFIARNCRYRQAPVLDAGEKITTQLISFDDVLLLADNPRFYERELAVPFLRMRLDPKLKEEFCARLFK